MKRCLKCGHSYPDDHVVEVQNLALGTVSLCRSCNQGLTTEAVPQRVKQNSPPPKQLCVSCGGTGRIRTTRPRTVVIGPIVTIMHDSHYEICWRCKGSRYM